MFKVMKKNVAVPKLSHKNSSPHSLLQIDCTIATDGM